MECLYCLKEPFPFSMSPVVTTPPVCACVFLQTGSGFSRWGGGTGGILAFAAGPVFIHHIQSSEFLTAARHIDKWEGCGKKKPTGRLICLHFNHGRIDSRGKGGGGGLSEALQTPACRPPRWCQTRPSYSEEHLEEGGAAAAGVDGRSQGLFSRYRRVKAGAAGSRRQGRALPPRDLAVSIDFL